MRKSKLVYGVGVNDADYVVYPLIDGRKVMCPFYRTWKSMVERCYSEKFKERYPTYEGCKVSNEWLTFSNFKKWMEEQDWKGKQLDKDLLIEGNNIYSHKNCIFVSSQLNLFVSENIANRGKYPIGVSFYRQNGKFKSCCCNPFTEKQEYLGYFNCPHEAHEAWRKRKHELACQWADIVEDPRLKQALRNRYKPH